MELIAKLIEIALWECYERGVIDWPGDDGPAIGEVFGECEMELNRYYVGPPDRGYWSGDWHVWLLGVYTIIDAEWLEAWHSEKIEVEV